MDKEKQQSKTYLDSIETKVIYTLIHYVLSEDFCTESLAEDFKIDPGNDAKDLSDKKCTDCVNDMLNKLTLTDHRCQ